MRALVKESAGPGIVLREVPVPRCGPSEVLIRVRHAGVCGTDLHIWEWDTWASSRLKPPVIVGHEFAGEITEVGQEAGAAGLLVVGDLVTAEGHVVCGHCLQCRLGDAHLCLRTQIIGVDRDGAFAAFANLFNQFAQYAAQASNDTVQSTAFDAIDAMARHYRSVRFPTWRLGYI